MRAIVLCRPLTRFLPVHAAATLASHHRRQPAERHRTFVRSFKMGDNAKEAKHQLDKNKPRIDGIVIESSDPPPRKTRPQPPEKPLPGDCCGSGCVRCVWDVYYEELEAYDKSLAEFDSEAGGD